MKKLLKIFIHANLVVFKPVLRYFLLGNPSQLKVFKTRFDDETLSGMVTEFNFWHRLVFLPFFQRVHTLSTDIAKIKNINGPVVFVMKNRGQLEYRYFNYLFLKEKIPLIHYANNCLTIFWWPFKVVWEKFICKLDLFYQKKSKANFDPENHVGMLLKSDKNVLLNLTISRDYLFGLIRTNPLQALRPLIRIQKELETPVHVVTLQFMYDKHPDKTDKSYFDLLFGEKSQPGALRKFILFLMNYHRSPQVKFGEPLNLKQFVDQRETQSEQALSEDLFREIEADLKIEKARITGPVLKPKDALIKEIMAEPDFKTRMENLSGDMRRSFNSVRKEAQGYLNEIGADVNYSLIHFLHVTLGYVWNRIYDGVVIKHEDLNKVREVAGKNPIVLVPMHRSHIDYMLISDIFYERNITFPHVCAGINLNFWPVGRILRKLGGFFIRRVFGQNKIYKESVYLYLKKLIQSGYCIEFYIEGTRSRTGKMLKPRMGILSMMMRAFFEKASSDIYFVPIAINYDQILEQRAYQKEGAGGDKSQESAGELIKARKVFGKKYGKVYVEFGDPISLKDYCEKRAVQVQDIDNMKREVSDFAYHLTYHVNRIAVVTPVSLVSMAILSINKQSLNFGDLMARVQLFKEYLDFKNVIYSDLINYSDRYAYNEAIKKLCERGILKEMETFEDRFYMFEDRYRAVLDYYKNNALHFFVSMTCFLKVLNSVPNHSSITMDETVKQFEIVKTLFRHDFTFSERASTREHLLRVIEFCSAKGFLKYEDEVVFKNLTDENSHEYQAYQGLLDNFLEAQLITLRYLRNKNFRKLSGKEIIREILTKARPMYLKDDLKHPESLSRFNLENTLKVFVDLGVLSVESKEGGSVYTTTDELNLIERWIDSVEQLLHGDASFRVIAENPLQSPYTRSEPPELH